MRTDSRLSRMLHVLLHMARHDQPFTSDQIARMLATNPVVVRRTMAGLKRAGYVRAEKGHGGGWSLACDLRSISLLDVHRAVGGPRIFAIGNVTDTPDCAVERVVNQSLDEALRGAETLLLGQLRKVTLADLSRDFDVLCTAEGWGVDGPAKRRRSPRRASPRGARRVSRKR
jgi:DNA-binding IscR family transcriptional regulator